MTDQPFLCDEKLGDRCKTQCRVCREYEKRQKHGADDPWKAADDHAREFMLPPYDHD